MRLSRNQIIAYSLSVVIVIILIIKTIEYFSVEEKSQKKRINITSKKKLDIIFGNDSAKLSVYMYGSYNCSYCRKFFTEIYPELKNPYIDDGQVNIIMRLTSSTLDQKTERAMKALVCVNHYGNYKHLHKLLLYDSKVIYTQEFQEMIDEFSIKNPFVGGCIDGNKALEYLISNLKEFKKMGLKGTPSFVIGNTVYQGYRPEKKFKTIIEKHLEKQ